MFRRSMKWCAPSLWARSLATNQERYLQARYPQLSSVSLDGEYLEPFLKQYMMELLAICMQVIFPWYFLISQVVMALSVLHICLGHLD